MKQNILICGMGVIGSIYALRLAKAGFTVTCLARGERLTALKENGISIHNILLNEKESSQVAVVEKVPKDASYDIIFVIVRSGQIMDVLGQLKKNSITTDAIAVLGNNLEDLSSQAAIFGQERFVAGFGAFGGYRKNGSIYYLDGRTSKKNEVKFRSPTTLGILCESARMALESVRSVLVSSGCRVTESPHIQSWFLYHAALVFPLAGAIYSAGGVQQRFCHTRDSITLGVRACHECFRALHSLGYAMQPKSLKSLMIMPEWIIVPMLSKRMNGEAADAAMFAHANAPGGHNEICGQAIEFDKIIRASTVPLRSWDTLLPYFDKSEKNLVPDGSRKLKLRILFH